MKTWAELTLGEKVERTAAMQGLLFIVATVALVLSIVALVMAE
jgi:hypothetical protein